MKEGNVINKSLSTLGKVMTALAERSAKASQHIPYRESVLTWLLRESLGGNSKTLMMAAISPSLDNFEETLSTLRYANQAKRIVNVAVVNEDDNTIMLRKLTEEIDSLRTLLAGGGAGSSSSSMVPLLPVTVEQAEQLAAQREQLAESEKLLRTMNESWEEKLAKTKSMQQARLDQLRAQGILLSQDGDAAVPLGVMAPQRTPYLLNIGRTVGQQCLVYYLHPGDTPVMPFTSAAAAHAQVHTPAPGGAAGRPGCCCCSYTVTWVRGEPLRLSVQRATGRYNPNGNSVEHSCQRVHRDGAVERRCVTLWRDDDAEKRGHGQARAEHVSICSTRRCCISYAAKDCACRECHCSSCSIGSIFATRQGVGGQRFARYCRVQHSSQQQNG